MRRELGQQGIIIKPIAVETKPGEAIEGWVPAPGKKKYDSVWP